MKNCLIFSFLFFSLLVVAQKKRSSTLGQTTIKELKMTVYEKDASANAVVLYEHGNLYVNKAKNFNFTTDYYFRVKILKKDAFDRATINIPLYGKEEIHDIKAITINLEEGNSVEKKRLLKKNIFTKTVSENWKKISFTLPNIKVGSVIEYKYSITSPYSQIDDWVFQSNIPKIKSDFTAAILGNWKYNIRINGYLKLDRDNPSVKRKCIYIPNLGNGSCLILNYGIDNVPAFVEEDYMLSKNNYLSKIIFDLKSYTSPKGIVTNYTKTWKDADKKIKTDFLDNQTSKERYFRKKIIHDSVYSIKNNLERAKYVFELIKNNFSWNGEFWPTKKVDVKKAYQNKKGNIFDINLSLFNALKSVNINSKLVLLSTRGKGVLTKLHPITNDFNYLIVKIIIDSKEYYLDASNKNFQFGLVRFDALNGDGRVMDFKNGSYWSSIPLVEKTQTTRRLKLELIDDEIKGDLSVIRTGYAALNRRNFLAEKTEEEILDGFETDYPSIEAKKYNVKNLNNPEKKLLENYKINIENDFETERKINLTPFIVNKFTQNPFTLKERNFPVDFGYPRSATYILSLKISDDYLVKKLPTNKSLSLPNKGGKFILNVKQKENMINVYFKMYINKKSFSNNEYFYLKEFYNQLINAQDTYIELERK